MPPSDLLAWRPGAVELDLDLGVDRAPRVLRFAVAGDSSSPDPSTALPIAEVQLGAEWSGSASSERLMGSAVGHRLRAVEHRSWMRPVWPIAR